MTDGRGTALYSSDLRDSTPAQRAAVFGEVFRNIRMISYSVSDTGIQKTVIVLDGIETTLVGDPEKALAVYRNGLPGAKRGLWGWLRSLLP